MCAADSWTIDCRWAFVAVVVVVVVVVVIVAVIVAVAAVVEVSVVVVTVEQRASCSSLFDCLGEWTLINMMHSNPYCSWLLKVGLLRVSLQTHSSLNLCRSIASHLRKQLLIRR